MTDTEASHAALVAALKFEELTRGWENVTLGERITDLIKGLHHLCDKHGLSMQEMVDGAQQDYEQEKKDEATCA